jgi:phage terminase large subunit
MGYNIVGAPKWSGSVEDGIEFMRSFKKIIIHPSLTETIEEFTHYSYKVDRHTGSVLPIVIDSYNHGIDSIRYALADLIKKTTTIFDIGVM